MVKRKISDLDLKIKLTTEYLENGGYQKIQFKSILEGLAAVKVDKDGKVDPNTVNTTVNAFMIAILQNHLSPPSFSENHISEYISTLQKALFFDQENIDTPEHFDKIYDQYKVKNDILFRGQREAKWRLYSKLQRQWITEKLYNKPVNYQTLIEILVTKGRLEYHDVIKELLKNHHEDTENDIAILGFLQHHGCPTPLLDWTFKFQNALYFAIDGLQPKQNEIEIEDYFSVYHIEEEYFDGGDMRKNMQTSLEAISKDLIGNLIEQIAGDDETKKKHMIEKFIDRSFFDKSKFDGSGMVKHMTEIKRMVNFPITYFSDRDKESGIIFSLNNSKNILNQAGVFTWSSDPTKPLEMVGNEQYGAEKNEDEQATYRFCRCFNINKQLESHVRQRLEADGITKDLIYPTVDIDTYHIFENNK